MKQIPLTKGLFAIVDDEDFEWLSRFKWCASWNKSNRSYYACRNSAPYTKKISPTTGKSYSCGRLVKMHKAILEVEPGMQVDHKNRNTLDNRRENLRPATRSQNMSNRPVTSRSQLQIKGVQRNGNGFMARIMKNRVLHYIGTFATADEAAMAYNKAAVKLNGVFAFPRAIRAEEAA